ncbi:MAG: hypothetical protein R3C28_01935 [Pirellulaceae bacterium]
MIRSVRDELDVTAVQWQRIEEILRVMRFDAAMIAKTTSLGGAEQDERIRQVDQRAKKQILDVLTIDQRKTLKQHTLQHRYRTGGIAWIVASSDIDKRLEELAFTDEQWNEIDQAYLETAAISKAEFQRIDSLRKSALQDLQRRLQQQLINGLTPHQVERLSAAIGKPIGELAFVRPKKDVFLSSRSTKWADFLHAHSLFHFIEERFSLTRLADLTEEIPAGQVASVLSEWKQQQDHSPAAAKSFESRLVDLLSPDDLHLLRQATLLDRYQKFGFWSLVHSQDLRPDLGKLALSNQQKDRIDDTLKEIATEYDRESAATHQQWNDDRQFVLDQARKTITDVFSKEQLALVEEVLGCSPDTLSYDISLNRFNINLIDKILDRRRSLER